MPILAAWIARIFASRIGQWIVSALVFLGLSIGTEQAVIGPFRDSIAATWAGMGGNVAAGLAYINVDKFITIILSAMTARATLSAGRAFLRRRGPAT